MILLLIICGIRPGRHAGMTRRVIPHPTEVIAEIMPYLIGRSLAWIPLIIAHLLFFMHFIAMLLRLGQPSGEPTLVCPDRGRRTRTVKQPPPYSTASWPCSRSHSWCWRWRRRFSSAASSPLVNEDTGDIYPIDVSGVQAQGRAVYVSQGCVACHTEQVRGRERRRGYRPRLGRAPDGGAGLHLREAGVARLYAVRAGPGEYREPEGPGRPGQVHARRGITCTCTTRRRPRPGSIMPSYKFLFEKRKIVGPAGCGRAQVDRRRGAAGRVTRSCRATEARDLVAYLTTLDHSHPLAGGGSKHPAAENDRNGRRRNEPEPGRPP